MGTALYYPYIDITDTAWLRTAVLFWDTIQTIAPTSVGKPYSQPDTRVLEQEGILVPLRCDLQGDVLNDLGRRVLTFIQREGMPVRRNGGVGRPALLHADKLSDNLRQKFKAARLHPEKMSRDMRALFANAASDEANFLLVDSHFADFYMAVLAAKLAEEVDASPLCSDVRAHVLNLAALVDQVASSKPTDAHGALVTVVMKSLNVDPATPMKELISFRRQRAMQLAELSEKFQELTNAIDDCETSKQLIAKAQLVYDRKVRPGLEKLKEELHDNGIGSAWGGFKQTALLTVGAGSVVGMATGWSAEAILGAGAFITIGDVAVQSYLAKRKVRRASPYSYLLDVRSNLHVPRHLLS